MSEAGGQPRRLAVVLSHPTQYYSPWFRWIRGNAAIELLVFYLWDFGIVPTVDPNFGTSVKWDVDLLSGYESEFVPNASGRPGAEHFFGFNNPGLARRLAEWRPDALLLFGYKWASHLRAAAWARRNRVPILFRGDSHFLGRGKPRLHVRLLLSLLFSRFSAFLYVGSANRNYFEALGVPPRKLFFCPHCVDASLFDPARDGCRAAAAALRVEAGISPSAQVVLFAGKLVAAKQPFELLEAFLQLNPPGVALVFVGEGPEKERLRRRVGETPGADAAVRFLPFANQSEMPARLMMADLLALPSRGFYETWGLIVNEAMHMGVPCLVSDRVGCQQDLVTPGETGWVFAAEDRHALRETLRGAIADIQAPPKAAALREAARRRISGFTYPQATRGLLDALASLGS